MQIFYKLTIKTDGQGLYDFTNKTSEWLKKNIDRPSAEVPTTVDRSGGGATMYSGGRDEGWINRMVMTFNKEARRIKQAHPDLTHVAFA